MRRRAVVEAVGTMEATTDVRPARWACIFDALNSIAAGGPAVSRGNGSFKI
jgi:hypothetical protein